MPARRLARSPLLAAPAGRRLLGAQAFDVVALGVGSVAVPWLVLDGGGGALAAGLAFATSTVPYVLLGLPAGLLGDRLRPGRVLGAGHAAQALLALVVPLWALGGAPPLGVLLATAFLIGCLRAFTDASAFAVVGAIAGRERFVDAQATLTAAWAAGLLVGPGIGGALIHGVGAANAMLVMAAAFGAASLLTGRLELRPVQADGPPRPPREALLAGLAVIARDPAVRMLTVAMAAWNVASTGAIALAVPLMRDAIGLDARDVGLVFAAGAAMGVVSAPLVGTLDRRFDTARVLLVLVALNGCGAIALGLAHGLGPTAVAYAAFELVSWTAVSAFIGARQRRAPADLQAIVGMSGRVVGQGTMTLGAFLASGATTVLPVRGVYVAMGVATVLVVLATARPLLRVGAALAETR